MTSIDSGLTESDFERICSEAEPRAAGLLRRAGVPPEDAQDLLQDCLVRLLEVKYELRDPVAWLLSAVHYGILLYWRAERSRRQDYLDSRLEAVLRAGAPADATARVDLMRALEKVPRDLQELLHQRYWQGLEPIEIARRRGCSTRNIRKRTAIGLDVLRSHVML